MVQFEWDTKKAKRNLKKHGVSFEEGVTVFYDPLSATFDDPDHSVGENRYITLVYPLATACLLSHTQREEKSYVSSARDLRPRMRGKDMKDRRKMKSDE